MNKLYLSIILCAALAVITINIIYVYGNQHHVVSYTSSTGCCSIHVSETLADHDDVKYVVKYQLHTTNDFDLSYATDNDLDEIVNGYQEYCIRNHN